MNGYFAVQLDKQSCNVVKKLATKDVLVSDHVTLAYKPIKKVYDKYAKLVGKKVGVFIKGYRSNDHIDALWVDNMWDKNGNKKKQPMTEKEMENLGFMLLIMVVQQDFMKSLREE